MDATTTRWAPCTAASIATWPTQRWATPTLPRWQRGETFTTVELKINFFRPVRQGRLTAEARVVKAGGTLGYVECDVKDNAGKLVAKAASTCMKLRQDGPVTTKEERR